MQVIPCSFMIIGLLLSPQLENVAKKGGPDRVGVPALGFSVNRPVGWYTFKRGEAPSFYNFRAEKVGPQGEFPRGGAAIYLLAPDSCRDASDLLACAQQEVRKQDGINVQKTQIQGPSAVRGSFALQLSFDQRPIGDIDPMLHFLVILWPWRNQIVGMELSFEKGDADSVAKERALMDMVRSFTPL